MAGENEFRLCRVGRKLIALKKTNRAVHTIHAGDGKHRVTLRMRNTGSGWLGSLTGGETPHVGGVVLAVPRPSLTGKGTSCDVWNIPVPGHLDNEVAAPLAKEFCMALGVPVSMTAGLHIASAGTEDIALLAAHCQEVGRLFLAGLCQA